MARRPEGPPPPPAVQRLRLHFVKRGRMRFTSHRDFQRAFERALRRAAVPMAYSAGFSPHPKVSYAGAAPTGVASEAEYLEIALAERRDPMALRDALDAALPEGLGVVEVVQAGPGSLADRLEASEWRMVLDGVDPDAAGAAAAAFLAAGEVEVERMTKNGLRRFDARAAVLVLTVADDPAPPDRGGEEPAGGHPAGGGAGAAVRDTGAPAERDRRTDGDACAILRAVVRHVTPAVRPDDVLAGLRRVADLAPPRSPRVTRLAQGPLGTDPVEVHDPLAPDRPGTGSPEWSTPSQAPAGGG